MQNEYLAAENRILRTKLPSRLREREMIRERTVAGVRAARAKGKKLGRPRKVFRRDEVARLREAGCSWRAIAKQLGVPVSTAIDSCKL